MTPADHLAAIHDEALTIAGLEVPAYGPGNLVVIRSLTAESKPSLARLIADAAKLKLRAKWFNTTGTLVVIGLPKPALTQAA